MAGQCQIKDVKAIFIDFFGDLGIIWKVRKLLLEREMEKIWDLSAIVVVGARQKLIRDIIAQLDQLNTPYMVCEDIYAVVARLAALPAGANIVAVGSIAAFMDMRILSLAPAGGKIRFCCIAKRSFGPMQGRLFELAKAGVFVIDSAEKIESVINQCRIENTACSEEKGGRKDFSQRIAAIADSFFLTQAEQDALLGVQSNAESTVIQ
jgi:hypothetical protein